MSDYSGLDYEQLMYLLVQSRVHGSLESKAYPRRKPERWFEEEQRLTEAAPPQLFLFLSPTAMCGWFMWSVCVCVCVCVWVCVVCVYVVCGVWVWCGCVWYVSLKRNLMA